VLLLLDGHFPSVAPIVTALWREFLESCSLIFYREFLESCSLIFYPLLFFAAWMIFVVPQQMPLEAEADLYSKNNCRAVNLYAAVPQRSKPELLDNKTTVSNIR